MFEAATAVGAVAMSSRDVGVDENGGGVIADCPSSGRNSSGRFTCPPWVNALAMRCIKLPNGATAS